MKENMQKNTLTRSFTRSALTAGVLAIVSSMGAYAADGDTTSTAPVQAAATSDAPVSSTSDTSVPASDAAAAAPVSDTSAPKSETVAAAPVVQRLWCHLRLLRVLP
jgi:cytoskeletal protein RodZ